MLFLYIAFIYLIVFIDFIFAIVYQYLGIQYLTYLYYLLALYSFFTFILLTSIKSINKSLLIYVAFIVSSILIPIVLSLIASGFQFNSNFYIGFRYFIPPALMILGNILSKKITEDLLFKTIIIIATINSLYGIFNLYIDNPLIDIGSYYRDIKGHTVEGNDDSLDGALSRLNLLFDYRLTGVVLEPLSAGFLSVIGFISLLLSNFNKYLKIPILFLLLLTIALTESRSSFLFLLIYYIFYFLFKNKKSISYYFLDIILIIFSILGTILYLKIEYSDSTNDEHIIGLLSYSNAIEQGSLISINFSKFIFAETGLAQLISDLGIIFSFSYFMGLIYIAFNARKNIFFLPIAFASSIIILSTFHYYWINLKAIGIGWLLVGYFYNSYPTYGSNFNFKR